MLKKFGGFLFSRYSNNQDSEYPFVVISFQYSNPENIPSKRFIKKKIIIEKIYIIEFENH